KQCKREVAILLTHFRRTKLILWQVHALLLEWIQKSKDRQEQIHYFYCLRLLHDGWTKEEKEALVKGYESTRTRNGGASFRGFLNNIFRHALKAFDDDDRKAILENGDKTPHTALTVVRVLQTERKADFLPAMKALAAKLESSKAADVAELHRTLDEAIL